MGFQRANGEVFIHSEGLCLCAGKGYGAGKMKKEYVLAYDVGTSGVKAVVVGREGELVSMASASYRLHRPHPGWAEQVPEEYWTGVCQATREAVSAGNVRPEQIMGMVFAAQWKGMIPIDQRGTVLSNSIIWMDIRASEEAKELAEASGEVITPRDYWPRILWFRKHYPELYGKTVCFLEAGSYLRFRATGERSIDASNHFTRSSHPAVQAYFDKMLQAGGLEAELFPPRKEGSEETGRLTRSAAEELGLVPGIPVFAGSGDISAVALGAGAAAVGASHVYLGTSGWIGMTRSMEEPLPPVPVPLDTERWEQMEGVQAACMANDWGLRTFYREEWRTMGEDIYAYADKELSQLPPAVDGLIAIPWLNGEMPPFSPGLRASFIGLTAGHDRRHLLRAVQEGVCYTLRVRKACLERDAGKKITRIHAVGGGTGSAHWMQILSDILQVPVAVPENARYAGALGAAYYAMIGLGICRDVEDCAGRIRIRKTYRPREEMVEPYDRMWRKFCDMAERLGDAQGEEGYEK